MVGEPLLFEHEDMLEECRVALNALTSTASSLSSGVRGLFEPLEQEIEEAAECCWRLNNTTLQVGKKFLLQQHDVEVTEAKFDEGLFEKNLKAAMADWRKAFDSSVASCALELLINEQKFVFTIQRLISKRSILPVDLFSLIDLILTAHKELKIKQPSNQRTLNLLYRTAKEFIQKIGNDLDQISSKQFISMLLKHRDYADLLARFLGAFNLNAIAIVEEILFQMQSGLNSGANTSDDSDKSLENLTEVLSSVPWESFLKTTDTEQILCLVQRFTVFLNVLTESSQEWIEERQNALLTVIKILQLLGKSGVAVKSLSHSTILVTFIAVIGNQSLKSAFSKLVESKLEDSEGMASIEFQSGYQFSILKWVQYIWRMRFTSNKQSIYSILRKVEWKIIFKGTPGSLKLPMCLALVAIWRFCCHDSSARLILPILRNVIFEDDSLDLIQLDSQDIGDARLICMTQAPVRNTEESTIWAWLCICLALGIMQSNTTQGESHAIEVKERTQKLDKAGEQIQEEDESAFEILDPLNTARNKSKNSVFPTSKEQVLKPEDSEFLDAMQFWELFGMLSSSGNEKLCTDLLLRAYKAIPGHEKLRHIAEIMSGLVIENPAKAKLLLNPIYEYIASRFEGEMPDMGIESSELQNSEHMRNLLDWAQILCFCLSWHGLALEAIPELLSQIIHAFHCLHKLSLEHIQQRLTEQLALDLGSRELIQLSSSLLALQKRQLISCQWLPVLSVWILNYLSKSHGHQDKYKGNAFSTDENENTANVDGKELDPQNKTKEQGQADINFSKISLSNLEDESSCEKERKQEQRGFGLDEKSQLQNRSESQNFSKGSPQLINLIVEEAVQLQEIGLAIGYAPVSLPLWDAFLNLLFAYKAQISDLIPKTQISNHLLRLAELYEPHSPFLGEAFILLASSLDLKSESRIQVLDNSEVLVELKRLHVPALFQNYQIKSKEDHQLERKNSTEELQPDIDLLNQDVKKGDFVPQEAPEINMESFSKDLRAWLKSQQTQNLGQNEEQEEGQNLPDSLQLVLTYLRLAQDTFFEHLKESEKDTEDIVRFRYQNPDLPNIEDSETIVLTGVQPIEIQDYETKFGAIREKAKFSVRQYIDSDHLKAAATILFQMEIFVNTKNSLDTPKEEALNGLPLLDALIEMILDHDSPVTATPFLMSLFLKARNSPFVTHIPRPVSQEHTAKKVMNTMTKVQKERDDERGNLSDRGMIFPSDERKEDKGCITEAFLLMKAAMDSSPENWFDESTFMSYGECVLATIFSLQDLNELSSEDASNILSLFEWKEFGSALLQNSELYTVLVKEQRVGRKESETKGNVAFLLSLYAALLSIEGGLNCANDIGELLLQPSSSGSSSSSRSSIFEYAAAMLQITLSVWRSFGHDVLSIIEHGNLFQELPLPVALEIFLQEKEHCSENMSKGKTYQFLGPFLSNTEVIRAFKAECDGTEEYYSQNSNGYWRADVAPPSENKDSQGKLPLVLLSQIGTRRLSIRNSTEDWIVTCINSALEQYGSGLEGQALNDAFNEVLTPILEATKQNKWMVDWVWHIYDKYFSGFLKLAGPASGGLTTTSFKYISACLPWQSAKFHSKSQGVQEILSHLLDQDRVVIELLHVLNWAAAFDEHLNNPYSSKEDKNWRVQIYCLALQAGILLDIHDMPSWLQNLLDLGHDIPSEGSKLGVSNIVNLISDLDSNGLQYLESILFSKKENVPFLLQPLVETPSLVQGDPGRRLVHIFSLMKSALDTSFSIQLASLSTDLICSCLCTSIMASTQLIEDSDYIGFRDGNMQNGLQCWHYSEEDHLLILQNSLLSILDQTSQNSIEPLSEISGNQALDGGKGHRSNSVDLKYPILIFLQILEDTSFRVLAANDALPFANASSPLTFSELPEKSPIPLHTQSSRISHSEAESVGDDSPSFWNSAFNRLKLRKHEDGQTEIQDIKSEGRKTQEAMSKALQEKCLDSLPLAIKTLQTLSTLEINTITGLLSELLVENLGHTAFNLTETKNQGDFSPDENLSAHKIQAKAGLKEVFMGRSEYELINIYNKLLDSSCLLYGTLASKALFKHDSILKLEKSAWRMIASDFLKKVAHTDSFPERPLDLVALWLSTLPWIGDARWRNSQSSGSEVLEDLLNSMQSYVEVLSQPPQPDSPDISDTKSSFLSSAADRFKDMKENWHTKNLFSTENPEDFVPDPSIPSTEFSYKEQEALGLAAKQNKQQDANKSKSSQTFSRIGQGFKKFVDKATPNLPNSQQGQERPRFNVFGRSSSHRDKPEGRSGAESESQNLDGLPMSESASLVSPRARTEKAEPSFERDTNLQPESPSIFAKARSKFASSVSSKEKSLTESREREALDEVIALSLAALAIQAFIKSVLCPSLSDYSPRVVLSSKGIGAHSRAPSISRSLEHSSSLRRLTSLSLGFHRHNASIGSTLSTGGFHDEAAMREIDQLMEAITEMDKLEEKQHHPLIKENAEKWAPFFEASKSLLTPNTSVEIFQSQIVEHLFPKHRYLLVCRDDEGND